jgi:hypothetical protein
MLMLLHIAFRLRRMVYSIADSYRSFEQQDKTGCDIGCQVIADHKPMPTDNAVQITANG